MQEKVLKSPCDLSVVIPVYQSADFIHETVAEVISFLDRNAFAFELILVNDGSRDGSAQACIELATSDIRVRYFELNRNFGQHNALLYGIREARGRYVVTMDDDGQHPPQDILPLLEKLKSCDVVYSSSVEKQHGIRRNLASSVLKLTLSKVVGADVAANVSAYRAFKADLRDCFAHYNGHFVSLDVLLSWATNRFGVVHSQHRKRLKGSSNYTWTSLFRLAGNMMTGFSIFPLQVATMIGAVFIALGVALLLSVFWNFIFSPEGPPRGFSFLASAIVIFSGVQLFILGVIGEYIARIHFNTLGKPSYFLKPKS